MPDNDEYGVACGMALSELKRTSTNVRRFWNLLYGASAATLVALVYGLILFAVGAEAGAFASGVATLVGGAGAAFLVKMKNDAVAELESAKAAVRTDCGTGQGRRDAGKVDAGEAADDWVAAVLIMV